MTLPLPGGDAALDEWLSYLENLHPTTIELGLDRIRRVAQRLELSLSSVVITVGGTNGKGSTCAMLESILRAAGYRTGLYTSPHLVRFNERIRINGQQLDDLAITRQFQRIEVARGDISLSYFEYTTLAALLAFAEQRLDAAILEVGLGGRLDAVNLIDADCSIVTSIDIDHVEWLGSTREQIGYEKAHIFRPGRPAICADPMAPGSLVSYARDIGADLWLFGRDFNYSGDRQQWAYGGRDQRRPGLAYPALRGMNQLLNASAALAALESLRDRLAVPAQAIRVGLAQVELPGRLQVVPGTPPIILDVAHNLHAAAALGQNLDSMPQQGVTHAVVGMLRDKDVAGVIARLASRVDHWYCAGLDGPRGIPGSELAEIVRAALAQDGPSSSEGMQDSSHLLAVPEHREAAAQAEEGAPKSGRVVPRASAPASGSAGKRRNATVSSFENPLQALAEAKNSAGGNDRILVFGSFHTVGPVLQELERGSLS